MGNAEIEPVGLAYMRLLIAGKHTIIAEGYQIPLMQTLLPEGEFEVKDNDNWDIIIDHTLHTLVPAVDIEEKEVADGADTVYPKPTVIVSSLLTNQLPTTMVNALNNAKGIIVPSASIAEVYSNTEGLNVDVGAITPGFFPDAGVVKPMVKPLPASLDGKKIFIASGFGSVLDNFKPIVTAYYQLAKSLTDTVLVLGVDSALANPGAPLSVIEEVKKELSYKAEQYAPIHMYDASVDALTSASYYSNSIAYISMSHGDVWGYGLRLAARSGLPLITTGLRQDFCQQGLVAYADEVPVFPLHEYGYDPMSMHWNTVSHQDLVASMKAVYENEDGLREKMISDTADAVSKEHAAFQENADRLTAFMENIIK